MLTMGQKYKLYEAGEPSEGGRLFLYHPEGRIVELRKVIDQATGREAIILEGAVDYSISEQLIDFDAIERKIDGSAAMPTPIWDYSLASNSKLTVVELRRIPDLFVEKGLMRP